ncbi:hypothetical protein PGN35_021840 [Nodosilinea sp. PGN35]|uniref:hypothetical protein n=1 Tax=Nodosilinea sp. PGN35 TaxID=3020489 RepID=UPI0023B26E3F|nr:hypothetical protein [Nodosilinea sp. TSF1-S3]MDF0367002.1 hypothetical protein [Nodosilinea sp. TSF1-S3]
MFHLYFGAFDIVLYLAGLYGAIALSKALCDQMDEAEAAQTETVAAPQVAPMQTIAPHLVAPAAKREAVGVRVSAD